MAEYNYVVYDRDGRAKMCAPLSCRYDRETERNLLQAGYVIRINGKKLTKKEVKGRWDAKKSSSS